MKGEIRVPRHSAKGHYGSSSAKSRAYALQDQVRPLPACTERNPAGSGSTAVCLLDPLLASGGKQLTSHLGEKTRGSGEEQVRQQGQPVQGFQEAQMQEEWEASVQGDFWGKGPAVGRWDMAEPKGLSLFPSPTQWDRGGW